MNREIFDKLAIDIQKELSFGIFNFNNTHIGYNDGFVTLGISIEFTGNVLTSTLVPKYLANYLESSTAEILSDYEKLPPVAPNVQAMMEESEKQYLAYISSNKELFESEMAKIRANKLKYSKLSPKKMSRT